MAGMMGGAAAPGADPLIESLRLLGDPAAYNAKLEEYAAVRAAWTNDRAQWESDRAALETSRQGAAEQLSLLAEQRDDLAKREAALRSSLDNIASRELLAAAKEQRADAVMDDAKARVAAIATDAAANAARTAELDKREAGIAAKEDAATKREAEAQATIDRYTNMIAKLREQFHSALS